MISTLETEFVGRRGPLFGLALRTGILTVLTLGIYRFWMKTRLRRFYWSSIRPGGHPLEYVGEAIEKLLGFLIAVVILAFYIGIVNLILMFISFSLFDENGAAYLMSFIGVIPLWFYARYRARRYVLARTRWRGIRFGVDPGAWGYAWRAVLYWALTICSGTLLWPLMTHRLEKFRIDRTWFGNRQLAQGGRWTGLVPGMVPFWLTLLAPALTYTTTGAVEQTVGAAFLALPFLAMAFAYYTVRSFRILTATKTAGPVRFESRARTSRVIGIYLLGYAATFALTGVVAGVLGGVWAAMFLPGFDPEMLMQPATSFQFAGFAIYFFVFVAWGAFQHIFVTQPLWEHYAATLRILGSESIHEITQRDRDRHTEAEGFAEALDLGAAI